jgi:hypothetical protein
LSMATWLVQSASFTLRIPAIVCLQLRSLQLPELRPAPSLRSGNLPATSYAHYAACAFRQSVNSCKCHQSCVQSF